MRRIQFITLILFAAGSAGLASGAPVTLTDQGGVWVLNNGVVTATIDKRSGELAAMRYHNLDLLGVVPGQGRSNGYWSLPGTSMGFGSRETPLVLVDPATNAGDRATVACKFVNDGRPGTVPADVELCYSLGSGDAGIYLWADWQHQAGYPPLAFPVGRFAAKLNPSLFDYLAVDPVRQRIMPTPSDWGSGLAQNMKEARLLTTGKYAGTVEHKYDYAAVQYDTPAYGWASSTAKVGLWMVTPSNEYMSGGPTKVELNAHLDGNASGYPTLLNVWKGPHYGGTVIDVAKGETWTKCIGPFVLYCNSAGDGRAMWSDAMAFAAAQAANWPFEWVKQPDFYTPADQRATVSGQIKLDDPLVSQSQISQLMVGLAGPDWQRDGKAYQFWAHGNADGKFMIPKVRPGQYELHAFATGVLGEFVQTAVKVAPGQTLDLGTLTWKPVRYGRQLWEIGIPNRTAGEFLHGDHYWQWGIYNQYPKDFPTDVHYVIGKSDYHKDWNLMQVPRAYDQSGRGRGAATTWSVTFNLPDAPRGKATLRLAFAGTEARSLGIAMNDKPAGTITGLPNTMAIHRDSDRSYWEERDVTFDAAMMRAGDNVLKLTVPAGPVTAGVEYDYLRLELDDSATPPARPTQSPPPGGFINQNGGDEG